MDENELYFLIRGAVFKVYNTIGPGLLESAYEAALVYELNKLNLDVQSQLVLPMIYDSVRVDAAYRIDILKN